MKFEVTHPLWLWLLPACVAWVVWLWRASPADLGPARRAAVLGLRLAGLLALLLALAGLRGLLPFDGVNVMFVLDGSDSVAREEQAAARALVARLIRDKPPDDRAGLIVFGREAVIEASAGTAPDIMRPSAVIHPGATDLAAGFRLALAALPALGDNRVVLLSDGNPTRGDAL
ncbi:MAG TPA: VWA domain-containing protein, partial [Verrucomicrobiota bacterium]|nr:VWA domain-containing protein [Verrucomicrobiota bacterium]